MAMFSLHFSSVGKIALAVQNRRLHAGISVPGTDRAWHLV